MFRHIKKEVEIFWRSMKNDVWATIIPGVLVTFSALYLVKPGIDEIAKMLIFSALYFTLYVYSFTLSNQISSVEEDLLNKPYRPIASKLITPQQAQVRLVIFTILFLILGAMLGIFVWAVLWVLTTLFHNSIGHRHWFTKNPISMSFGILAMIGAGWEIVAPLDTDLTVWAVVVSLLFGCMGVIQDFRDVAGDRALKRVTLPLAIGDKRARIVSSIICISALSIYFSLFFSLKDLTIIKSIFGLIILVMYSIVILRLNIYRDSKSDHKTYMFLLYLFNITFLSSAILF